MIVDSLEEFPPKILTRNMTSVLRWIGSWLTFRQRRGGRNEIWSFWERFIAYCRKSGLSSALVSYIKHMVGLWIYVYSLVTFLCSGWGLGPQTTLPEAAKCARAARPRSPTASCCVSTSARGTSRASSARCAWARSLGRATAGTDCSTASRTMKSKNHVTQSSTRRHRESETQSGHLVGLLIHNSGAATGGALEIHLLLST